MCIRDRSYAEPLVRVFHDALSPTRDVDITKDERAGYMLRAMTCLLYTSRCV